MRNVLMVAVSVFLLVAAWRASFASDGNLKLNSQSAPDPRASSAAASPHPNQNTPANPSTSSPQNLERHTEFVVSKEAWQWTDDERIAARLDPVKIRERAAAHAARSFKRLGVLSSLAVGSGEQVSFRIDGAENPELFLPFELFGQLLRGVDWNAPSIDRDVERAILAPKIKSFGYEPDRFWTALGSVAKRYFEVRDGTQASASNHARAEATQSPSGPIDAHIVLCRERQTALTAARAYFGREKFDRFLYEVVAPTLSSSSRAPDGAQGLRYMAGGCQ